LPPRLDRPRQLVVPGVGTVQLPAGVSMGEIGAIAAGPVAVDCGGGPVALPPVEAVAVEKDRGLQYRYHDLLLLDGREKP
jgi:hypothetical protein